MPIKFEKSGITFADSSRSENIETSNITLSGNVTFVSNSVLEIPSGNTAQRPSSPVVGTLRYNTTDSALEVYTTNNTWAYVYSQTA